MWWGRERGVHWGGLQGRAGLMRGQGLGVPAKSWVWAGQSAMETKGHGGCGAGFGLL